MWFAGRILSVNVPSGRIRVARGPTETAGPATIDCIVARRAIFRLHPGMLVDIQADTRSEPWRVLHLRPLEFKWRGRSHLFYVRSVILRYFPDGRCQARAGFFRGALIENTNLFLLDCSLILRYFY